MKHVFICFLLSIISTLGICQLSKKEQSTIDSLKHVIETSSHDSDKVNAYYRWDNIIYIADPDLDFELNQTIAKICQSNLNRELNTSEDLFFTEFLSSAYNNIALGHSIDGDYTKALNFHNKALKMQLEINDTTGLSNSYNNIGNIYSDMDEDDKALEYYQKSLELALKSKTKSPTSAYTNIGRMHAKKGENIVAMEYYQKSLKLDIESGYSAGMLISYSNIGDLHLDDKNYAEALNHYKKGLKIAKTIGSIEGQSLLQVSIADIYYEQKNYTKAIELGKEAMVQAKVSGGLFEQNDAAFLLYQSYQKINDHKNALIMYEQFILLKDSVESETNQKSTIQQEFKHAYDTQKVLDDNMHEKELLIAAEQEKKQKLISYFSAGSLLLVLAFSFFIVKRLQLSKKQNQIIEHQKQIVETKNKEITDSIQYAKRIQKAILPPDQTIKKLLGDSFVLYKPKDIVAGDFYWAEEKDNCTLFAAADCTGHGVPGAMVSVVCNNALNRSVREHGLTDPGEILNKTREIVVQEFERSDDEVRDGMDIALCSLEGNKLKYAGAHNPLWIIRKNELLEIKANKQPVGKFDKQESYTTHSFDLIKEDTIYIFSDGYADQFGGEKGKKLKKANFKKLLLSIQQETMPKQCKIINDRFEQWKGDLEQLDDVCVIGIRV